MKKSILLLSIMFLVMLSGCNTNIDNTKEAEKIKKIQQIFQRR